MDLQKHISKTSKKIVQKQNIENMAEIVTESTYMGYSHFDLQWLYKQRLVIWFSIVRYMIWLKKHISDPIQVVSVIKSLDGSIERYFYYLVINWFVLTIFKTRYKFFVNLPKLSVHVLVHMSWTKIISGFLFDYDVRYLINKPE